MPQTSKTTFSATRCILDCTKIFCQKRTLLSNQRTLYSSYVTNIGLLGIAPSRATSFISELYAGAISDKVILGEVAF